MSEIKAKGPEGCVSVNVGGDQYNINKEGFFVVDESVFPLLAPHGFEVVGPVDEAPPVEPEAQPEEKPKTKKKSEPVEQETPAE